MLDNTTSGRWEEGKSRVTFIKRNIDNMKMLYRLMNVLIETALYLYIRQPV